MGVDRSDYIVYGWKLPYEILDTEGNEIDVYDEKFESMMCGFEGEDYTLICDGMCGNYNVFGLNVQSCDGEYEGWDFADIDIKKFDDDKIIAKFIEVFGFEPQTEPKLFIFSHFS